MLQSLEYTDNERTRMPEEQQLFVYILASRKHWTVFIGVPALELSASRRLVLSIPPRGIEQ